MGVGGAWAAAGLEVTGVGVMEVADLEVMARAAWGWGARVGRVMVVRGAWAAAGRAAGVL